MKIFFIAFIVIALGVTGYFLLNKTTYLSKGEFEIEYRESKKIHSVISYNLLKIDDKYVYLVKKEMTIFFGMWKEKKLYTEFNKLSKEIQKEINESLE